MKKLIQIFYILLLFNASLWSFNYTGNYSKIVRFDEIYFQNSLADSNLSKELQPILTQIDKEFSHPHATVQISLVGHSKHRATKEEALQASKEYVQEIYDELLKHHIDKNLISKEAQADKIMLYSDETEESNALSNRVNINMYVTYLTDDDHDGVYGDKDKCPDSKPDAIVDENGCSAKDIVILVEGRKKNTAIVVSNSAGSVVIRLFNQYTLLNSQDIPPISPKKISQAKLNKSFENLVDIPTIDKHYTFYFDDVNILDNSKKELDKMLVDISKIKNPVIKIIGQTDTVGSDQYNEKLGLARAKEIEKVILKSNVKVLKMSVLSYGEKNLAVKTADNVAQKLNRRVEVFIR
jgi:outer membrane protein OmpA-like peptidoglycan-associated protein